MRPKQQQPTRGSKGPAAFARRHKRILDLTPFRRRFILKTALKNRIMRMKNPTIFPVICAALLALLASCTQYVPRINERPYQGRPVNTPQTEQPTGIQSTLPTDGVQPTQYTDPSQLGTGVGTVPTLAPTPGFISTPPAPSTPSHPGNTGIGSVPSPTPPAPAQPTVSKYPVAMQVPGDPLRVYSPADPSKTVKIVDKFGNRQPSGKKLYDPFSPGGKSIFLVP